MMKSTNIFKIFIILILSIILLYCATVCKTTNEGMMSESFNPREFQIVVSRYNENLDWLKKEPFSNFSTIIYNKGDNDNFYTPENAIIKKLPNVGKCDHTYLYHIIENYDNLPNITIFLPGSTNMSNKIEKAKKQIEKCVEYKNTVFISTTYNNVKNDLFNFTLDKWKTSNDANYSLNRDDSIKVANPKPFGLWYEKWFPNINIKHISWFGILGISKKHIYNRPKSFYKDLIKEVDNHPNPEVGHYIERSWEAIFHPMDDAIF